MPINLLVVIAGTLALPTETCRVKAGGDWESAQLSCCQLALDPPGLKQEAFAGVGPVDGVQTSVWIRPDLPSAFPQSP